jgi:hypothetical protein
MGRIFSFIGLLIAAAVGIYLWSQQAKTAIGGPNTAAPTATVNIVGVQNDLLSMANAERRHFALAGRYVSLDQLVPSGEINRLPGDRGPCSYDASVSDASFRISATCTGQAEPGKPRAFSIDETMQIHSD